MNIERIELRHIKMKLVSPFVTSMGTENDVEHIIVRIDSEGITGWGECVAQVNPFYSYETVQTAWHILQNFLIPSILGKNLSTIDEAIKLYYKALANIEAYATIQPEMGLVDWKPLFGMSSQNQKIFPCQKCSEA